MLRIAIISCTFLALALTSQAQEWEKLGMQDEDVPLGLDVGTKAPDFSLKTIDNQMFKLSEALEQGPVAITFYRGYWCGHCSRALSRYTDSLSYLQAYDVQLVAISPENYEGVEKSIDKSDVAFTVLSDPNSEVMKLYDVDFKVTEAYDTRVSKSTGYNLVDLNDADSAELPIPATYIIFPGKKGKGEIIWRHFDPVYKNRASVKSMLDAVKGHKS